jgi:hypothetical protein
VHRFLVAIFRELKGNRAFIILTDKVCGLNQTSDIWLSPKYIVKTPFFIAFVAPSVTLL